MPSQEPAIKNDLIQRTQDYMRETAGRATRDLGGARTSPYASTETQKKQQVMKDWAKDPDKKIAESQKQETKTYLKEHPIPKDIMNLEHDHPRVKGRKWSPDMPLDK
jgi:hypothetical protein